jgi:diguanylate cyclase (GGDEF)-like protein
MELSSRVLRWKPYVVPLLVGLTLIVLLWHHFGMERVLELSAADPHAVVGLDDSSEGVVGQSHATLVTTQDGLLLKCQLRPGFAWPYCKFHFVTGTESRGLDFSDFESISFDLRYTGPAPHRIKLFLINSEPNVSTVPAWTSRHFNEVEFELPAQQSFTIPTNLLRTADWWISMAKVPLEKTYTRIDNVVAVELATVSSAAVPSELAIELHSIRFHGKWISKSSLLTLLVSVWIACGLVWMALGILRYRADLAASHARLELMDKINNALELETRELVDQAYTDPLTGALNRQGLRDMLLKRMHASDGYSEGLAVLFMDLDFFKLINDRHGHDAGDDVLRRFAAMIRTDVRTGDKLVRWGGEEFLLICPDTNAAKAAGLAEKLREAMQYQAWPHALTVTASFGVTALKPGEGIGIAIARADSALYRAKSNGRNRVELA